jgi:hypothetical protein
MKLRQSIFLPIALMMIAGLVACGGSSSTTTTTPPPPPAISVAISPAAPATLAPSATASLTAVVSNDTTSGGVNWSCAPAGTCGTFGTANPIASGTAVIYTAPATSATVTVTATSVKDSTKSASATITIGSVVVGAPLADGSYVFSLSGNNVANGPYSVAGVFTVLSGAITGGEQDYKDNVPNVETDAINPTGSAISTASGNLQITLATCLGLDCTQADTVVGVAGVEILDGSLVSSTRALVTEFDAAATSSGTLDLQSSTAATTAPAGGYAFVVSGANSGGSSLAIGGIINVDGPGTISGTGSSFDLNNTGVLKPNATLSASTISGPDSVGRVTISLVPTTGQNIPELGLAGYIVDANRIRLVESTDAIGGATSGTALFQTVPAGGFTNGSISGQSYVNSWSGGDVNGVLQVAGVLAASSSGGTVGGFISYNDLVFGTPAPVAVVAGATFSVDAFGRVTMTGVSDGFLTINPRLYLDGNGNALTITMDPNHALAGVGFLQGSGSSSAASFTGTYVLSATGPALNAVGPVTADGVGAFSGTVDLNDTTAQTPALPVSGTFVTDASGDFTGTITGLDVTTPTNADAFTYYLVDTTKVVAIETDTNQITLGYFEASTP